VRRYAVPVLLTIVLCAPVARTQILSVYGTYSAAHFSSVESGAVSTVSATVVNYTSFWASGVGGGVTFGFPPIGPVKIGFDVRGSTRKGTSGADLAMVGPKVGFKLPIVPLKPYIQASGGYIATRTPDSSVYAGTPTGGTYNNQYIAYEVLGGVDYSVLRFIDLRLIEIGGGEGFSVGQVANASGVHTSSQRIPVLTIDTGIVVHF